jgi:hypothetical protein
MENLNKKNNYDDLEIEKLLKKIEKDIKPRPGFKQELLFNLINHSDLFIAGGEYTFLEKFIFEKPWRLIIPLSLAVAVITRFSIGGIFDKIVLSFFTFGRM